MEVSTNVPTPQQIEAAQAQENKIIVFNKTDIISDTYGPRSDEVLTDIVQDFRGKLKDVCEGGAIRIFPLSARLMPTNGCRQMHHQHAACFLNCGEF